MKPRCTEWPLSPCKQPASVLVEPEERHRGVVSGQWTLETGERKVVGDSLFLASSSCLLRAFRFTRSCSIAPSLFPSPVASQLPLLLVSCLLSSYTHHHHHHLPTFPFLTLSISLNVLSLSCFRSFPPSSSYAAYRWCLFPLSRAILSWQRPL